MRTELARKRQDSIGNFNKRTEGFRNVGFRPVRLGLSARAVGRFLLAAKLRNEFYPTSSATAAAAAVRHEPQLLGRSFTEVVPRGSARGNARGGDRTSLLGNHLGW